MSKFGRSTGSLSASREIGDPIGFRTHPNPFESVQKWKMLKYNVQLWQDHRVIFMSFYSQGKILSSRLKKAGNLSILVDMLPVIFKVEAVLSPRLLSALSLSAVLA